MLNNLKIIFVHGVNEQTTNYSRNLYSKILSVCNKKFKQRGRHDVKIETLVQHETLWADLTTDLTNRYQQLAMQQETPTLLLSLLSKPKVVVAILLLLLIGGITLSNILDLTTAFIVFGLILLAVFLLREYLARCLTPWFNRTIIQGIDPLVIQIMRYIKDKGDKRTGEMNILKELDHDIKRIFSKDNNDVGYDPLPGEGKNVIIVAHSLGSVIAFDYIMRFRKDYALREDITVRSFVTIGSPIPLFISAMGHPDSDITLPQNIKRWINVINPLDGVARSLKSFFRNMTEDTFKEERALFGWNPLNAHTGYWDDDETAEIIAEEIMIALNQKDHIK